MSCLRPPLGAYFKQCRLIQVTLAFSPALFRSSGFFYGVSNENEITLTWRGGKYDNGISSFG